MGNHTFLQGIFPTQVSNPGLPHCGQILYHLSHQGSPVAQLVKNPPEMRETQKVRSLGQEDLLEKGQATHYSWASLVTQLVKNPPAIRETWV